MTEYRFFSVLEHACIDDYMALFSSAFPSNDKLDRAYLEWLYVDNPDGRAVGMDAYLDGQLAAHYVTIPRQYRLGDTVFKALLSVNTATHPAHQRRGLFKRLAEATYELGASQGFHFVLGAANENSTHGFIRSLDFALLGQIRMVAWNTTPATTQDCLRLDSRAEWLDWRLRRPGATYRLSRSSGGIIRIQTRLSGVGVTLGFASALTLPTALNNAAVRTLPWLPNLTPVFPVPKGAIQLPDRIHPSPWNVIFRPLSPRGRDLDTGLLQYDGLAMDTF